MTQVDFRKAINNYINIVNSGSNIEVEKAKYNILWEAANFLELVVNYIVLSKNGLMFDFGKKIISKGTRLYRIREYKTDTDFSKVSEWSAPPHRPQNRANFQGQEALYLGSTENICLLETHIKKYEKYVLGIYEVIKDIEIGGFMSFNTKNMLYNYAGMVLNAFLIAPARNEINKDLFSYLDSYYGKLTLDNFTNMNELKENGGFELPIKFGVLNQLNQYYNLTNQVCEILSVSTPSGIRYSSCYIPFETIGIECSDHNIVLYHEGIEKVKFIDFEVKTNIQDFTGNDVLKAFLGRKK